jgi:zinc-binding alcohol dehydrogenase/oxidoreductase
MALQFAVALGCHVFVTSSSPAKIAQARKLGAIAGFDYNSAEWGTKAKHALATIGGEKFDSVIDGAGKPFPVFYVASK